MSVLRSLLFIPGDSEKKLGNGDRAGADALVLDLEDSVLPENKARARGLTVEYLKARPTRTRRSQLWVRINPLDSALALADLSAVVAAAPDGVMLPKAEGPADVARLSFYLDALEAQAGLAIGSTRVLPVATETAAAPFNLGAYCVGAAARGSSGSPGAPKICRPRSARARIAMRRASGRSPTASCARSR